MSIKISLVAKIPELLQSPHRRSTVTVQNQEMIVKKMFLDVDKNQVEIEMIKLLFIQLLVIT